MGSFWSPLLIVACYLIFVLKLGPDYMKHRRAFELKYALIFYNLAQVLYNTFMFSMHFSSICVFYEMLFHSCVPLNPQESYLSSTILKVGWHFMFSKFLDFFDTVFFVLRKKQSQVSFLHVYHHANMALVVWAYIKYSRGSYGPLVTILNTFIHAVMYGYYLLAALGPQVQKNLWWKQHLTRIQLAQFIIVMSYLLGLLIFNCELSKAEATFMFLDCSSFFFLFLNFYRKAYLKSAKNIATPSPPVHVQPLDENKMK
ncbi:unnamed protein product [Bemisia tabaci]|uniref:Elongation of very long chain fatty acids protein n=1 Tax=Bemisia tabaci TaxID=7038 RepID=A0A9P0AHZ1_BEMTA|nr:unnamed protein product [Bemisia tabaci]